MTPKGHFQNNKGVRGRGPRSGWPAPTLRDGSSSVFAAASAFLLEKQRRSAVQRHRPQMLQTWNLKLLPSLFVPPGIWTRTIKKTRCLFGSHRPERRARQQSGGAAPDRNIRWRPCTAFMESSCESAAASFLPLMNEISHAAALRAAAHQQQSALLASAFHAFKHLIGIRQFLTHILGTNTPLIETFN